MINKEQFVAAQKQAREYLSRAESSSRRRKPPISRWLISV